MPHNITTPKREFIERVLSNPYKPKATPITENGTVESARMALDTQLKMDSR